LLIPTLAPKVGYDCSIVLSSYCLNDMTA
jgi:hypothetical protein